MLSSRFVSQVLKLFHSAGVQKCTTLKNILAILIAIVDDLFSVGNQRVQLFETVSKILSGIYTISEVDGGHGYTYSSRS